jgi:hypothetical protein
MKWWSCNDYHDDISWLSFWVLWVLLLLFFGMFSLSTHYNGKLLDAAVCSSCWHATTAVVLVVELQCDH